MTEERACRKCRTLTREDICPTCGSSDLSPNWSGMVIILDVEKSDVAKAMGVKKPGRYALNIL